MGIYCQSASAIILKAHLFLAIFALPEMLQCNWFCFGYPEFFYNASGPTMRPATALAAATAGLAR